MYLASAVITDCVSRDKRAAVLHDPKAGSDVPSKKADIRPWLVNIFTTTVLL